MTVDLGYILKNEHYRICGLLTADGFIDYCSKRGIKTTERELERLEELEIFYPFARSKHVPYTREGQSRTEYARFYFGRSDTEEWLKEGLLWDPRTKPFVAWESFHSDYGPKQIESYYSRFQIHELHHRIEGLGLPFKAHFWVLDPGKQAELALKLANDKLLGAKKKFLRYDISRICQIISNRYYPFTQTNQRYFSLSAPYGWDWYQFSDKWEPRRVLDDLSLKTEDIRKAWEMMVTEAKSCDPLEHWYELVSFIAIEQRQKLKDDALRAQMLYAMEHMLRLFYFDLTKEKLPTPEGPTTYKFVPGHESPVSPDPLVQLENLTNDFNINPRPILILLVEGESEAKAFPYIIERLFGSTTQTLGIQVIPLHGVGNFEGSKRNEPQGALVRFIDDYHSRGTIVFLILDNENRVKNVKPKLLQAQSIHQNRMVTKPEYVVIWDKNVELDNFTDQEIAEAMSSLTSARCQFSAEQIEEARTSFCGPNKKGLDQIYSEISGNSLDKPLLLNVLMDLIPVEGSESTTTGNRPIISVIKRVIQLAQENRPRTSRWEREGLAHKGLYGESATQ